MNKTEIQMLETRLTYTKNKLEGKSRGIPEEEKERVRKSLISIAEDISKIIGDNGILEEVKSDLESSTRKQLVLMRKTANKLQEIIEHLLQI